MDHVAIDLGGMESQICVRSSDGKIVEEGRATTRSLPRLLAKRAKSRVIVETCAEAFRVADAALAAGHEVRVVPATLVRTLGVGSRRVKNDVKDAQVLSEVSARIDLPSVHIPSQWARDRKTQCGMREALVSSRTQLVNSVRGWLRALGANPKSGRPETFPVRVRERLERERQTVPEWANQVLEAIEALNTQIAKADEALKKEAQGHEVCTRLMSVPGVGPVTAVRFVAALDQVGRFADAHQAQSYLGLTPGEDSSSARLRRTGITKAGPPRLRWALVQACWSARRCRPEDPLVRWTQQVEQRRGRRVAIVAMARKLAGILYAMWRDGTAYDAQRAATKRAPSEAPHPRDEESMRQALALLARRR